MTKKPDRILNTLYNIDDLEGRGKNLQRHWISLLNFSFEECYEFTVSYFYRFGISRRFCAGSLSDEPLQIQLNPA